MQFFLMTAFLGNKIVCTYAEGFGDLTGIFFDYLLTYVRILIS